MPEDINKVLHEVNASQALGGNQVVLTREQWRRLVNSAITPEDPEMKAKATLHYLQYSPTGHLPTPPSKPSRWVNDPQSFMLGWTVGAATVVIASIIVTAIIG